MSVCPSCGKKVNEADKFCFSCGVRLASEQSVSSDSIPPKRIEKSKASNRSRNAKRNWFFTIIALVVLSAVVISAILSGNSISEQAPAITQKEQEVEDGWIRIRIKDIGSIDYPADFLELQSGEYRDFLTVFNQIAELPVSDFTLQQAGLNDLEPSAFSEYRRIAFSTEYLNPGEEVLSVNEKYTFSQSELAELHIELIEQLQQEIAKFENTGMGGNKIIDPGTLEIKEICGMFPLTHTYKRRFSDNPVVLVQSYVFQDYDMMHYLVFSYRIEDEDECEDIYDKILASFKLR